MNIHFVGCSFTVKGVYIFSLAHGYVMQVILKAAFSLDYANQSNSNNLLVSCSQDFVRTPLWIQRFSEVPILRGFIKYLPWGFKSRLAPFLSTATEIVSARRKCENQTPQVRWIICLIFLWSDYMSRVHLVQLEKVSTD